MTDPPQPDAIFIACVSDESRPRALVIHLLGESRQRSADLFIARVQDRLLV